MSKASIDTSLTETLIYEAPSIEMGMRVRAELIYSFENCWFFLYTNSNKLYATNEWGGKLKPEVIQALQDKAVEINKFYNKEKFPSATSFLETEEKSKAELS